MMEWRVTYYNTKVQESVLALPKKLRARYFGMTDAMLEEGPNLGMPHTRSLGGGLLELRVKAQEGIARVFYCTVIDHEIKMLHTLIKKTQKTPQKDLELARARLKEVKKNG